MFLCTKWELWDDVGLHIIVFSTGEYYELQPVIMENRQRDKSLGDYNLDLGGSSEEPSHNQLVSKCRYDKQTKLIERQKTFDLLHTV